MSLTKDATPQGAQQLSPEAGKSLSFIPHKGFLFALIAAWIALFHFFGNSTLGYVNTPSIFGWWWWMKSMGTEEEHVWMTPLVVLMLFWIKRDELIEVPKKTWWPAFGILFLAIALHLIGFRVQQTRISVIGLLLGIYSLTGLMWGFQWMKKSAFLFALLIFCMPLGNSAEYVTFPLRMLATKISVGCSHLLGIDVIQDGSRVFDPKGTFEYEIAPACSGIRSLVSFLALGLIYGFLSFKSVWKRGVIVLAAVPLAVVSNIFRLLAIIIAAQAAGQSAGNYVHESSWVSLLFYVPGFGGMFLLGWLLRDKAAASHKTGIQNSAEA